MDALAREDPEVFGAIQNETWRLYDKLQLIASENYVSQAVLEATGSILSQKYAEGLPGKRYYQGCEWIDEVERLAISRAKAVFGADHANVQLHSGSQANMAVYFTAVEPGDTVLAMNLSHGGHLTHGSGANFSGKLYRFVHYGIDPVTERLDYDAVATLADQHRPKLIVAGATAYPRIIDFARFQEIAQAHGAMLMVDMAHIAGLVAGGVHPSPVPHADFVSSSTHKTLRGPRGGFVLCRKQWGKALDRTVFPGMQGGPLEHVIAAKVLSNQFGRIFPIGGDKNDNFPVAILLAPNRFQHANNLHRHFCKTNKSYLSPGNAPGRSAGNAPGHSTGRTLATTPLCFVHWCPHVLSEVFFEIFRC